MNHAESKFGGRLFELKSNQSLILDDPEKLWIVRDGELALLSTRVVDGRPIEHRRFLQRIRSDQGACGVLPSAATGDLGLIAVAAGATTIEEASVSTLLDAAARGEKDGLQILRGWVDLIASLFTTDQEQPATITRPTGEAEIVLSREDALSPPPGEMVGVRVLSGVATLGRGEAEVRPDDPPILITSNLWLAMKEDGIVACSPVPARGTNVELAPALQHLHSKFNLHMHQAGIREAKAEMARRELSAKRRRRATTTAIQDLASVLSPRERFERMDTALLTAVGIIGKVMRIKFLPPAASEDPSRAMDPIEGIARASRVRYRKVLLGPDWHKRDSGPLLGFLGDEEHRRPVALIHKGSEYHWVDPDTCAPGPLTAEIEAQLSSEAYMFYRSLPMVMTGVRDLVRFTASGRARDFLFVFITGVTATLLGMIVPMATGTLVDSAIPDADRQLVYQLGMILAAAGIASATFTWAQSMATVRTGTLAEVIGQSALWDRLLRFKPQFFRKYSSGDLQSRVTSVTEISRELNGATLKPLITGVLSLLNLLLLWYYSWELATIAIWIGLILLLMTLAAGHFIRRHSYVLQELQGKFNGLMIQMIGGVGKLRVAGSEHRAFNHWVKKYTEQVHLILRIQFVKDLVHVLNLSLPVICSAILFWKGVDLIIDVPTGKTRLTTGNFIAFNTAFILFLTGITDISNTAVQVLDTVSKGRRVRPIMDALPEVADDASDPGRLTGAIQGEDLVFRYIDDGPLILNGVSFKADPGEYIAFVGPSGSGKSTILRMLLGFEQPESGRILYDGQDLAGLDVLAVRRQLGTVLQNGRLNAGSIFENIANNSQISHVEAWDSVADAGMNEDIESMPMALHTMVSEGGFNLSGGQRQRLLIARALATRPKLVFFDEATSALDNRTQAVVSEALGRRHITRVVIAHRLSTIRRADRIYVVDRGRIVQVGTFEELKSQRGLFMDLMRRQMA